MAKLRNEADIISSNREKNFNNLEVVQSLQNVTSAARDAADLAANGIVLGLSKAWIGLSLADQARGLLREGSNPINDAVRSIEVQHRNIDRKDTRQMWSLKLADYFAPVSQTFNVRAQKTLNISKLVDGVDVIQQTHKGAKVIDCQMRISVAPTRKQLNFVDIDDNVATLAEVLNALYETDSVFEVQNDMINKAFKVRYAMVTEFRFAPRAGFTTYTLDFTLTEVQYGENVLTFDLDEVDAATNRQIIN